MTPEIYTLSPNGNRAAAGPLFVYAVSENWGSSFENSGSSFEYSETGFEYWVSRSR